MNFAIARTPARQVLCTVVGEEEKYKAKNLIDVVIYRGLGRALRLDRSDSLQALDLKMAALALFSLPVVGTMASGSLSMALGRTQERRAAPYRARRQQKGLTMARITRRDFTALAAARSSCGRASRRAMRPLPRPSPAPYPAPASACRWWGSAPRPCSTTTTRRPGRPPRTAVVRTLIDAGGQLIDASVILRRRRARSRQRHRARRPGATRSS